MEIGLVALILPYLIFVLIKGEQHQRQRFIIYLVFILTFFIYLILKGRAIVFLQMALLLPWYEGALTLWYKLSRKLASTSSRYPTTSGGLLIRTLFIAGLFLHHLPHAMATWLKDSSSTQSPYKGRLANTPRCDYERLFPYLDRHEVGNKTILAPIFDGPMLAYKTGYSVISSPYHRNRQGIDDGFILGWSNPDDPQMRSLAAQRNIEYVLVCRRHFFDKQNSIQQSPQDLYPRLLNGDPPDWLVKVPLPQALAQQFLFYQRSR